MSMGPEIPPIVSCPLADTLLEPPEALAVHRASLCAVASD